MIHNAGKPGPRTSFHRDQETLIVTGMTPVLLKSLARALFQSPAVDPALEPFLTAIAKEAA